MKKLIKVLDDNNLVCSKNNNLVTNALKSIDRIFIYDLASKLNYISYYNNVHDIDSKRTHENSRR